LRAGGRALLARSLLGELPALQVLDVFGKGRIRGHDFGDAPLEIRGISLQRSLVDDGFPLRVYVPYGTAWYPYLTRRMAERPANLAFFLRSAVGR